MPPSFHAEPGGLEGDHGPPGERVEYGGAVGVVVCQFLDQFVVGGVPALHCAMDQRAQLFLFGLVVGPGQQRADHRRLRLDERSGGEPGEQRLL